MVKRKWQMGKAAGPIGFEAIHFPFIIFHLPSGAGRRIRGVAGVYNGSAGPFGYNSGQRWIS
jgi:hypothetical protein